MMRFQSRFFIRRHVFVALMIALSLFLLHNYKLINFNEPAALDLRMLLRGEQPSHDDIIIVEIDDESLAELGAWPWDRDRHREMLEILKSYQAKIVFYDIPLHEADNRASNDKKLILEIEQSANVILPFYYFSERPFRAFFPEETFRQSARGIGFTNLNPDADGRIRRIRPKIQNQERVYFHIALQIVMSSMRDEENVQNWLDHIPVTEEGDMLIHYPGTLRSFKHVSFNKVLELVKSGREDLLRNLFEGRVVLVGLSSDGYMTFKPTAFSPNYPNLAIYASAVNTLLTGEHFIELGPLWVLFIMIGLCLLLAIRTYGKNAMRSVFFTVMVIGAYFAVNFIFFSLWGLVLPVFLPLAAMLLTYISLLFSSDLQMRFEGELLGRELSMASRVQATFLPKKRPAIEGLDIAFQCRFAKHVGGDFYDWWDLGEGRIALTLADVSGKGVPAAIYMVRAISEFRREITPNKSPSEILGTLNELLAIQSYAGMFFTGVLIVIDTKAKKVAASSAGHEPLVFYRAENKAAELIDICKGPPIGLFTDSKYETSMIDYSQGDMILLFSDGVSELRDMQKRQLGMPALQKYVQEHARDYNAAEMIKRLFELMDQHRQKMIPHDDRTLLCVKFGNRF